jgi:hypothetical protein
MERMLNLGTDTSFGVFDPFDQVAQRHPRQDLALARVRGYMPSHWEFQILCTLLDVLVASIAKGISFVTMQERLSLGHVTYVGGCTGQ